jgi:hypothetical protein
MSGPEDDDRDDRQLSEQSELEQGWLGTDKGYLEWLDSLDLGERE